MKECTLCHRVLDLSNFSKQKNASWKYYAWCDECRSNFKDTQVPTLKPKKVYLKEVEQLRNKAKELRKFNDIQVADIKQRRAKGDTVSEIASDYGVNNSNIYRALRYRN